MSSSANDVVITCAISGLTSREVNPRVPITPEEMAAEAKRAVDAGAGVIHVHGRDPDSGAATHDLRHCAPIVEALRAEVPGVIINFSAGGPAPLDERLLPVATLRPELATCSLGSFNYAAWAKSGTVSGLATDTVMGTTFASISKIMTTCAEAGAIPDMECFELGHLDNLDVIGQLGFDTAHAELSIILGVMGNMAANPRYLEYFVERMGTARHWTALCFDMEQYWSLLTAAIELGGSVRVGFEDCHWIDASTPATSNAELVANAVHLAETAGRRVATGQTARELVGCR